MTAWTVESDKPGVGLFILGPYTQLRRLGLCLLIWTMGTKHLFLGLSNRGPWSHSSWAWGPRGASLLIPLSSLPGCHPGDVSYAAEQLLGGLGRAARHCELVSRPQAGPHRTAAPARRRPCGPGHALLLTLPSTLPPRSDNEDSDILGNNVATTSIPVLYPINILTEE